MKTLRRVLLVICMLNCLVVAAQEITTSEPDLVSRVEWSSDGSQILVALQEGGLYTVDSAAQTVRFELPGNVTGPISDAGLQPGGDLIATVDRQSTLSIWDSRTGRLIRVIRNNILPYRLAWSPDGQYLFTTSIDEMYMRDATGNLLYTIPGAPEDIPLVEFSPDGELLLLSFSVGLEVVDVDSQQTLASNIAGGLRQSIQWSADGTRVLSANVSNTREGTFYNILVINPMTGELLRTYSGFPARVSSAQWSPDETQIVATSDDGNAYLVDAASGVITPIFSTDVPILSADWSPYGGQLAIGAPVRADMAAMQGDSTSVTQLPVQIIVPDPSPERLQAIAAQCGAPLTVERGLDAAIAAADYADVIAQIDALPAETIPPACAADLRAVAAALASSVGQP